MKTLNVTGFLTTVLLLLTQLAGAQDAQSILKKVDEVMFAAKDMTAKNTIVITDRTGKEEKREAMVWQKGQDMRLFRFTAPASQAGIAFLSLPNDVMYLYLPAFGRERRIASSAKNQQFAGTDFTYDDLEATSLLSKYDPTLISAGENYLLELKPKKASEYSKVIARVNKTHHYPEFMEFYDRAGNKVKQAEYTFKRIGNYWNASEIKMTDLKRNRTTRLILTEVKYDAGLTNDDFSIRKLME
ncbi:MAG: outer membrane lipoprotein-sorting protein [Bacteroidetes bacterium]|nr:outer membrane lipoprotein-sorting protein [Bacteroidota bacterium]